VGEGDYFLLCFKVNVGIENDIDEPEEVLPHHRPIESVIPPVLTHVECRRACKCIQLLFSEAIFKLAHVELIALDLLVSRGEAECQVFELRANLPQKVLNGTFNLLSSRLSLIL
jgi:hypothetical protein